MASFLPPVVAVLSANISGFTAKMGEARAEMRSVDGSMAASGVGARAFAGATAIAGAAVLAYSVHAASGFQAMYERLHTVAGATQADLDKNRNKVLDLATSVGMSGTAMAEALYHPLSVGYSLAESLRVARMAAEEARITGASFDDTMYSLTSTMKAFNLQGSQAAATQGMLHAIVAQGDMKYQDFNLSIKNLMPTLASMGISLQSGGAALAYLTDRGMNAEIASTRLTMALALVSTPTKQAAKYLKALGMTSSDVASTIPSVNAALRKAGLTTTHIADDLRKPDGIMVALRDLRDHMHKAGLTADATTEVLAKIFGGGRTDKAALSLIQNLDNVGGLAEKYQRIGKSAGSFGEAWTATTKTFRQTNATFVASLENLAVKFGMLLLPVVARVEKALMSLGEWVSKHRVAWAALAGIGVVVAAVLADMALSAVAAAAPFLLAAAAVAAVAAGLYELYMHSAAVRKFVSDVAASAQVMWHALVNVAGKAVTWLGEQTQAVLKFAGQWWKDHGRQVTEVVRAVWAIIKLNFDAVMAYWRYLWPFLRVVVETAWKVIKDVIGTALKVISDAIGFFADLVTGHWSHLWSDMKKWVADAFNGVWNLVKDFTSGALGMLEQAGKDLIQGLINGIGSMAGAAGNAVKNVGKGLVHSITGLLGIHSPSRVFHGIGRNIAEGLALGLDEHNHLAYQAALRLAQRTVAGAMEGRKGHKHHLSGVEQHAAMKWIEQWGERIHLSDMRKAAHKHHHKHPAHHHAALLEHIVKHTKETAKATKAAVDKKCPDIGKEYTFLEATHGLTSGGMAGIVAAIQHPAVVAAVHKAGASHAAVAARGAHHSAQHPLSAHQRHLLHEEHLEHLEATINVVLDGHQLYKAVQRHSLRKADRNVNNGLSR